MSDRVQALQEENMRKVVRRYERGRTVKSIAQDVGVSPPTVAKWLTEAGYRRKPKGRIPLAMKARVYDLASRGWEGPNIARLLGLDMKTVSELSKPKENPVLGGERDPLKLKGEQPKKKSSKKRVKKKKKKKIEAKVAAEWPPPRHKCRKHWTKIEKDFVYELMVQGASPLAIYKRMRASKKRQAKIWKERGGKGSPPNFPESKAPFTPIDSEYIRKEQESLEKSDRIIKELESEAKKRQEKIDKLQIEAMAEKARMRELQEAKKQKAIEGKRQKALTEKRERELKELGEATRKRLALSEPGEAKPPPRPKRRKVMPGSYEDVELGLPVGSTIKRKTYEYADNGRYFVVSNDWADLSDADEDDLKLFASFLTSKGFPARVGSSGDQPKAFFESSWPKSIEKKWVAAVDKGVLILERYNKTKNIIKRTKRFTPKIRAFMASIYDGYRNDKISESERKRYRSTASSQWGNLNNTNKYILIYYLKFTNADGDPTPLGIERSHGAKIMQEKSLKRIAKAVKKEKEKDSEKVSDILAKAKAKMAKR